jgi:hypothetical protein
MFCDFYFICLKEDDAMTMNVPMLPPQAALALAGVQAVSSVIDAYSKIVSYRLEGKRLDAEMARVAAQAKVMHHQIDAQYAIQMKTLKQAREELELKAKVVVRHLADISVKRHQIISMMQAAQKTMHQTTDLKIMEICLESIKVFSSDLKVLGQDSQQSLALLLAQSQYSLESNQSIKLLEV